MNMHDVISCPNCRHEIDLNKAVKNQLSSEVNIEYKERYKQKDIDLAIKADKNAQDAARNEQKAIEIAKQQEDFNAKVRDKEQEASDFDKQIEKRALEMVNAKTIVIAKEEKEKAEAIYAPEMTKASNTENENIELRQKVNALEQSQKNNDQKNDQKVDEALAKQQEKHNQDREFDKIERDKVLTKAKEQLQKGYVQVNQGSSQAQGSAGETSVKNRLESLYPFDKVTQTKNGADLLQEISSDGVNNCGMIYFEIKRTTRYEKKWLPKLKSDGREKKANVLMLISETLPPGMTKPEKKDGVWICSFNDYQHIAKIHRDNLIEANKLNQANENSVSGSMLTYNFVNSDDYERHVETMFDGLSQTHIEIESEKKFFNRAWAKRIATSELIMKSLSSIDGTFKAYSNNSKSEVESLEMAEIGINE